MPTRTKETRRKIRGRATTADGAFQPGDVIVARLRTPAGHTKPRPAVVITHQADTGRWLVAGLTSNPVDQNGHPHRLIPAGVHDGGRGYISRRRPTWVALGDINGRRAHGRIDPYTATDITDELDGWLDPLVAAEFLATVQERNHR